jgi:hypothetical protein
MIRIVIAFCLLPVTSLGIVAGFIVKPFIGGFVYGYDFLQELESNKVREELIERQKIREKGVDPDSD